MPSIVLPSHSESHDARAVTDATGVIKGPVADLALTLLGAFLVVAAGYRLLGTGRDFLEYVKFYDTVTPYFRTGYSRFEPGFEVVSWIFASLLKANIYQLFTVLSGFAIAVKFYLFRCYLGAPWLAVVAYILFFYALHDYIQIRVAVAMAFSYLAIFLLLERRYAWMAIAGGLAFLFQSSSVIVLVVALGGAFVTRTIALVGVVIAAFLSFTAYSQVTGFLISNFTQINPFVESYLNNAFDDAPVNLLSITNLAWMISLLLIAVAAGKDFAKERYERIFFSLAIAAFLVLIIFSSSPVVAYRCREMLLISAIFLIFRRRFSWRTAPAITLTMINGLAFSYLLVQEGVFE